MFDNIYIFYATLYESLTKVPHGSQPRSRLVILWANLLQIFGCSSFLVWSICWVAIFRNFFGVKIQHLKYMTCWDSTNLLTAGTDVYVTTPSNYRGLQGLTKLQALLKFRGWLWGLDPGIHEVFFLLILKGHNSSSLRHRKFNSGCMARGSTETTGLIPWTSMMMNGELQLYQWGSLKHVIRLPAGFIGRVRWVDVLICTMPESFR